MRVYTGLVSLSTSAACCFCLLAFPCFSLVFFFFFLAGRCDSCIVTKESYNLLNCVFFTGFEIFIQKKKNRIEFFVLFLCSTTGKESTAFVSVSAERYLLESRYKFPSSWVSESTVRLGPPPFITCGAGRRQSQHWYTLTSYVVCI